MDNGNDNHDNNHNTTNNDYDTDADNDADDSNANNDIFKVFSNNPTYQQLQLSCRAEAWVVAELQLS